MRCSNLTQQLQTVWLPATERDSSSSKTVWKDLDPERDFQRGQVVVARDVVQWGASEANGGPQKDKVAAPRGYTFDGEHRMIMWEKERGKNARIIGIPGRTSHGEGISKLTKSDVGKVVVVLSSKAVVPSKVAECGIAEIRVKDYPGGPGIFDLHQRKRMQKASLMQCAVSADDPDQLVYLNLELRKDTLVRTLPALTRQIGTEGLTKVCTMLMVASRTRTNEDFGKVATHFSNVLHAAATSLKAYTYPRPDGSGTRSSPSDPHANDGDGGAMPGRRGTKRRPSTQQEEQAQMQKRPRFESPPKSEKEASGLGRADHDAFVQPAINGFQQAECIMPGLALPGMTTLAGGLQGIPANLDNGAASMLGPRVINGSTPQMQEEGAAMDDQSPVVPKSSSASQEARALSTVAGGEINRVLQHF